jgi:tetratricopeptide (TPR) repeat protein
MSPANAYYYNDAGRVYEHLQYHTKAEEAYRQSVFWDPSSPLFNINWAESLRELGQGEESKAEMNKAFELDPGFTSKVLAQMAFEKYRAGDKPLAFQYLGEAIKGDTSCPEAYFCRGVLYLSENKKSLALKDLETVQNLHPTPDKNPYIQNLDLWIEQAKK